MSVVNRFNVNSTPVTLDADIIENMSANDVSYESSFQYDENTIGSKLSELESKTDQINQINQEVGNINNILLTEKYNYFSLIGNGTVQQHLKMYVGEIPNAATKLYISHTPINVSVTPQNHPAIYVRFFNQSGEILYNNPISENTVISIPDFAVKYEIILFATVTGQSEVGATYSLKIRFWFDNGVYALVREENKKDIEELTIYNKKTKNILELSKNLCMAYPFGYDDTYESIDYEGDFDIGVYTSEGYFISSITFIKTSNFIQIPTKSDFYYIYGDFAYMNDNFCNLCIFSPEEEFIAGFNIQGRKLVRVPKGYKIKFSIKGEPPKFRLWVSPISTDIKELYNSVIKNTNDISILKNESKFFVGEPLSTSENYETGDGYMNSPSKLSYGSFGRHGIYSNIPSETCIKIECSYSTGSDYYYLLADENDNILESFKSKNEPFVHIFNVYNIVTKLYVSIQGTTKFLKGSVITLSKQVERNTNLINSFIPTTTSLIFGIDGDSITSGNQWSKYMIDELGGTQYNVAVGSSCWSYKTRLNIEGNQMLIPQHYKDPNFVGFGGSDFSTNETIQKFLNNNACTHIEKFITNVEEGVYQIPNIFIFAMGTNGDTGYGNREGSVDEAMSALNIEDSVFVDNEGKSLKYSMCGAMRWCIQTIKEAYPNCKVFVSLPIQRSKYNVNKTYLYPKIQLIREMAIQMGCQIIDQYKGCGITAAIEKDESPFGPYLIDGLHPNTNGQQLMGKYAASQIKKNI